MKIIKNGNAEATHNMGLVSRDEIKFSERFRNLYSERSDEKMKGLEDKIINQGMKLPLICRKSDHTLLFGYEEYELAVKHNITPTFFFVDVSDDDDEAELWVRLECIHQKYLEGLERKYNIGRFYLDTKKPRGGNRYNGQNVRLQDNANTAERIAKEYGLCERTVRRNGDLAKAIDRILKVASEIRNPLFQREIKTTDDDLISLSELSDTEILKAVKESTLTGRLVVPNPFSESNKQEKPENDEIGQKTNQKKASCDDTVIVQCKSHQIHEVIRHYSPVRFAGLAIVNQTSNHFLCYAVFGKGLKLSDKVYSTVEAIKDDLGISCEVEHFFENA